MLFVNTFHEGFVKIAQISCPFGPFWQEKSTFSKKMQFPIAKRLGLWYNTCR
jgi:hypothetical protein